MGTSNINIPILPSLNFSYTTTSKFNITIKTPENGLFPTKTAYKSVHVKYTLPRNDNRWNIVAIEPFIPIPNEIVQQITVHLCQVPINTYQQNAIWYDDGTNCNDAQSMLIYQWTSYSSLSSFRISDDLGFQLDASKSIVLTVTYFEERQLHDNQTGIILYISTLIPRFHVGTTVVGNKQRGIRFSCRSLNYPRLLYGVKSLFSKNNNAWWNIYVIRNRQFGRKLLQSVLDSSIVLNRNKTDIDIISPDIFLTSGDYIIIECEKVLEANCNFLIYYIYKNLQYKYFIENDYICRNNDYPDLFKLIPSKIISETNKTPSSISNMDRTTIFLLIGLLLFGIWISIIIGCVIMRRIRKLVNYRTESILVSPHKAKSFRRATNDHNQQRITAEGDHIAQLDIEHMGLMS